MFPKIMFFIAMLFRKKKDATFLIGKFAMFLDSSEGCIFESFKGIKINQEKK